MQAIYSDVFGLGMPVESAGWELPNEHGTYDTELNGRDADFRWERSKPLGGLLTRLASKVSKPLPVVATDSTVMHAATVNPPALVATPLCALKSVSGASATTSSERAGGLQTGAAEDGGRGLGKGRGRGRGRGRGQPTQPPEAAPTSAGQGRGSAVVPRTAASRPVATAVAPRYGEASVFHEAESVPGRASVLADLVTLGVAIGAVHASASCVQTKAEGSAEGGAALRGGGSASIAGSGKGGGKGSGKGRGKGGRASAAARNEV